MDILSGGEIDFKGQELVTNISNTSMVVGTALAFIVGYFVMGSIFWVAALQFLHYITLLIVY